MAVYFFDSSGLAKRYLSETGTAWVLSLTDPAAGNDCYVARIAGAEVVSAVARRERVGGLSATDAAAVFANFEDDFDHQYRIVEISPVLIKTAMALAKTHGLRGYDAVQLAAAFEVRAVCQMLGTTLTLVSADADLNAAATAEGLVVENPNTQP